MECTCLILVAIGDSSSMILYLFYAIKGLKNLILERFSKVAEMLIFENFASKPLTQY